jgi:hypothetical protein
MLAYISLQKLYELRLAREEVGDRVKKLAATTRRPGSEAGQRRLSIDE